MCVLYVTVETDSVGKLEVVSWGSCQTGMGRSL